MSIRYFIDQSPLERIECPTFIRTSIDNRRNRHGARKALELLATDKAPDEFKNAIRTSAEQKIAKLKGSEKK